MFYDVIVLILILFNNAYASDLVGVRFCAAVQNWELGSIDFYQAVVNAGSVESGHGMFDSADRNIAFSNYSTAVSCDDIVSQSIDHRLIFEVDTLNFVSVIVRRGTKSSIYHRACMQSFAAEAETFF